MNMMIDSGILRRFFFALTGGRPMVKIGYAFTDVVSGKPVFYYKDYLNRYWIAENSWGFFRVRLSEHLTKDTLI
jgi:hypothetical protein